MATMEELEALEDRDELVRVEFNLPEGVIPNGRVYLAPDVVQWIKDSVPRTSRRGQLSEYQRLLILMKDIVLERRLTRGESHPCHPKGDCVWELKVGATRIFGYFTHKNVFVGVTGATKGSDLPNNDAYTPYVEVTKKLNRPGIVGGSNS